jgi:hypothetical protein
MAATPYFFTISHGAEMLGEDEDWLHAISVAMDPEEGCLWVFGVGEHGVPAFTEYGIECLKQIIANHRAGAPRRCQRKPSSPCGAHRLLTAIWRNTFRFPRADDDRDGSFK